MRNMKTKKGFTLMELMVYIAILGIVVLIAGQAFTDSTRFRIRTQNIIKATQEAENVATYFKSDVSQVGAKSSKEETIAGGDDKFSDVYNKVYMDPANSVEEKKDSSSFKIETQDGFDKLTIRRVRYDANGHFNAVEEIKWYVESNILHRSCQILEKKDGLTLSADDPCADINKEPEGIEMATGVQKFEVHAARPGVNTEDQQYFPPNNETEFLLFPRVGDINYVTMLVSNTSGELNKGGDGAILSQFFSNYDQFNEKILDESYRKLNQLFAIRNNSSANVQTDSWKNLCSNYGKLEFEPNQEYEISFEIPYPGTTNDKSILFVPGTDHMSVGFRNIETGEIPKKGANKLIDDFLFFPPLEMNGQGKRTMRFSVSEKVENVCLAFTFAAYSPLVSQGTITIKNLKINKIPSSNYDFETPYFDPEANITEKQNVKALKLDLQINRGGKNNGGGESAEISLIIPTPSNGPKD